MATESVVSEVEKFMRSSCRIQRESHVLVGLSGGPDSVALAEILRYLQAEVSAVHVNHRMRGEESDGDEQFVRHLTRQWEMPLHVHRLACSPSSEEKARDARLGILSERCAAIGADAVALGHHRDDQAETVLLNLLRGAGTRGLRGILPRRGLFVHPLLELSREEIVHYLRERGLTYRIDSSNRRPEFRRNRLRLELFPYLKDHFNPQAEKVMAQSAEILRADEQFLASEAGKAFRRCACVRRDDRGHDARAVHLAREEFLQLPLAMQRRILRLAVRVINGTEEDLTYANVSESLEIIAQGGTGSRLQLPGGLRLVNEYASIYLSGRAQAGEGSWSPAVLPVPGQLILPGLGRVVSRILTGRAARRVRAALLGADPPSLVRHAFIDYNKVDLPIWMRSWRAGDRIRPLGLSGEKKVQDLFVDDKIPRRRRRRIPLVFCSDRIAWVVGVRLAEEYRVDNETKQILHLWFDHTWPTSR